MSKYQRNKGFWDSSKPSSYTYLWSKMLESRASLKQHCCWMVGNGNKVHIWQDQWVTTLPDKRITFNEDASREVTWVSDLLLPDASWNGPLLRSCFSPYEVNAIGNIRLSEGDDELIWTTVSSGDFSTKAMYKHLSTNLPATSCPASSSGRFSDWSLLWRIKDMAPRVKLVLWKAIMEGSR